MRQVTALLQQDGADLNTTDGVRVRCAKGWWLLRASNTQAVLVARAEADDQAGLDVLREQIRHYLSRLDIHVDAAAI